MSYEDIIFEKKHNIAIITFNRPEKLNAITPAMRASISECIQQVSQDNEVRVLIITGAGRGFCSGADLTMSSARTDADRRQALTGHALGLTQTLSSTLRKLTKPTIAAVNGVAAGAGFSIMMACDIVVASENARFSSIFVKRGLVPDLGLTHSLPRLIGIKKALELLLTGDMIDSGEAQRIGLVNRVVPHQQLMEATRELATKIADGAPIAVQLTRQSVYQGIYNDLDTQIKLEFYNQSICHASEDYKEGVRAFLEKRKPEFKGT